MPKLTLEDIEQMSPAYLAVLDSVPKGNSEFQTMFFGTSHVQPQRTRRAVIMEINGLESALHENTQRYKTLQADIRINERNAARIEREIEKMREEKKPEDEIADKEDEVVKLRALVERDRHTLKRTEALANDAVIKLKKLIEYLNALPEVSREEFEAQEASYYMERLLFEATLQFAMEGRINNGTLDSILHIPTQLEDGKVGTLTIGDVFGLVEGRLREQRVEGRLPHHVGQLLTTSK